MNRVGRARDRSFVRFRLCQNGRVEEEIRAFLVQNFPLGEDVSSLDASASLIDAGVIDSTGVLELVAFVEERYGIVVEDEELLPENLDSIERIAGYVQRKRAEAAAPAEP